MKYRDTKQQEHRICAHRLCNTFLFYQCIKTVGFILHSICRQGGRRRAQSAMPAPKNMTSACLDRSTHHHQHQQHKQHNHYHRHRSLHHLHRHRMRWLFVYCLVLLAWVSDMYNMYPPPHSHPHPGVRVQAVDVSFRPLREKNSNVVITYTNTKSHRYTIHPRSFIFSRACTGKAAHMYTCIFDHCVRTHTQSCIHPHTYCTFVNMYTLIGSLSQERGWQIPTRFSQNKLFA